MFFKRRGKFSTTKIPIVVKHYYNNFIFNDWKWSNFCYIVIVIFIILIILLLFRSTPFTLFLFTNFWTLLSKQNLKVVFNDWLPGFLLQIGYKVVLCIKNWASSVCIERFGFLNYERFNYADNIYPLITHFCLVLLITANSIGSV